MYLMLMIFNLTLLISLMIMKISMILSKKMKLNMEKMSPFECGFNPIYFKRMPFSIRFFLITVIFLIFDIEIVLLLPIILSLKLSNKIIWFLSSLSFTLIILSGLIYEWKTQTLNWI